MKHRFSGGIKKGTRALQHSKRFAWTDTMMIGVPFQGGVIQEPLNSEGDALGYDGAGLWPAYPANINDG
jgi:hypothetical protein